MLEERESNGRREGERGVGHRGYVTLIMWREDGFVFSGEQLALVFQFQCEKSNAVEEQKDIYFCPLS